MRDTLSDLLFKELQIVSGRKEFVPIHTLLASGDYLLECTYRFDFHQANEIPATPFAFIYRKKAYRARLDVANARASTKRDVALSQGEVAVGLARIGASLADIYFRGLFKQTSAVLLRSMKQTFRSVVDGGGAQYQSRKCRLAIACKRVDLLTIHHGMSGSGDLTDQFGQALTDPDLLLRNTPGRLTRLAEQPWLQTLRPDARASIEMGTQILDALYVEGVRELLPDYGVLLFPFARAADLEIVKHFRLHADDLINTSMLLVRDFPPESFDDWLKKKQNCNDPEALFHVAERVLRRMDNFRPNMHSLYHFLSYFGLRRDLDLVSDFGSYLPDWKARMLRRWGDDFRWILDMHYRRNRWANGAAVKGSFEFELWYEELCRLLKLLAALNAEKELS